MFYNSVITIQVLNLFYYLHTVKKILYHLFINHFLVAIIICIL